MESLFPDEILARFRTERIAAVLVLDNVDHAVPVARALAAGGVHIMELTLRTPVALDCLRVIREEVPEMLVGAGTVLSAEQVDAVLDAGAAFGVAPGVNPSVILHANECGLPFAPGVMTPTDIDTAVELGCRELKFFPAVPAGGRPLLSAIKAPYAHLGLSYIPLGGIHAGNLHEWLADPDVLAIGGSWLAPPTVIQSQNWPAITAAAAAATQATVSRP